MKRNVPWDTLIPLIREIVKTSRLPSVSAVAEKKRDPFRILISTMISLRTKDEVTSSASERLFEKAADPESIAALPVEEIADLIYPAGFYRTKAAHIRETSRILRDSFAGRVPADRDTLLTFPGVGVKTANLTLNLGFGIDAICVDTHVHRISNRMGWVSTSTPHQTETALMKVIPQRYWIEINELLVRFGQTVCSPVSPFCSTCSVAPWCSRIGVTRSR